MIAGLTERIFNKLQNKEYRSAYAADLMRSAIAYQIRAIREDRGLRQGDLAKLLGKGDQSAVSRIEDPDYGRLTISTLAAVAKALDVGLLVRFVSFPDLIKSHADVSPEAFQVENYSESFERGHFHIEPPRVSGPSMTANTVGVSATLNNKAASITQVIPQSSRYIGA